MDQSSVPLFLKKQGKGNFYVNTLFAAQKY